MLLTIVFIISLCSGITNAVIGVDFSQETCQQVHLADFQCLVNNGVQ